MNTESSKVAVNFVDFPAVAPFRRGVTVEFFNDPTAVVLSETILALRVEVFLLAVVEVADDDDDLREDERLLSFSRTALRTPSISPLKS